MTDLDIQKIKYDNEVLAKTVDYLTKRNNEFKDRLLKVETVLNWWVNIKMVLFGEKQYGKKELKDLLYDLQRK